MIYRDIEELVKYGLKTGLIEELDKVYIINQLLELFRLSSYEKSSSDSKPRQLYEILNSMCRYAFDRGIILSDSVSYWDLFDTKIMGILTARPSQIIDKFKNLYAENPKKATDYFYSFSKDVNYIRRDRIKKDLKWLSKTEYGNLVITVNLSKPEKDPKAIAAAKNVKQGSYPKCQLCYENEGYSGRIDHPARQNHRIMPVKIDGGEWGFQYSPYVYYNEHCIVFNKEHIPMKIDKKAFSKLFEFVEKFPHYFIGSNTDLPIVGGSILSHEHFQGGNYSFPMAQAPVERDMVIKGYEDISVGIVKWPMSVIRINGPKPQRLVELADYILSTWKKYEDKSSFIFAVTNGEPHNAITPIARIRNGNFEMDLVLRNNITTKEHPLGVYHPHAELHHIKKENIGLIEVMGMAILPARLKLEMELLSDKLVSGESIRDYSQIEKHADWAEMLKEKYGSFEKNTVNKILENEIGLVFKQVLEDAGVFKRNEDGMEAFIKFIDML